MSDIFPNVHVERDMTTLFICILYIRGRKDINVKRLGLDPFEIWRAMGYQAFGDSMIPTIVNRLINNGIRERLIQFDDATRRITITPEGIQWAERINCRRIPGVFN
jgi:hypothetical protein